MAGPEAFMWYFMGSFSRILLENTSYNSFG